MKKIMTILAIIALIFPFANVFAFEVIDCATNSSCYVHPKGSEVNFYKSEAEAEQGGAGTTALTLSDGGASEQFVKVLWGGNPYSSSFSYRDETEETIGSELLSQAKSTILQDYATRGVSFDVNPESEYKTAAKFDEAALPTLSELTDAFGSAAVYDYENGVWNISVEKYGKFFETLFALTPNPKGFYTSTTTNAGTMVWVIEFTYEGSSITAITGKQVSVDTNAYQTLLAFPVNKTYECVERTPEEKYACYACGEEYTWTKVGTQADTCTLVTNINSKNKCSKNPKTGVKEYAIELTGVIALCAVALVIAKKKDLFRTI